LRLHAVSIVNDRDFAAGYKGLSLDGMLKVTDLINDDAS
jgi:hypothetical protein